MDHIHNYFVPTNNWWVEFKDFLYTLNEAIEGSHDYFTEDRPRYKYWKRKEQELIDKKYIPFFKGIFETNHVRILNPLDNKYFLIVGDEKHTAELPGQWTKNGEEYDFEYIDEQCIASGETFEELLDDAKKYLDLIDMTWVEYFEEEFPELDWEKYNNFNDYKEIKKNIEI